jgi:hypothetical protein
VRFNLISYLLCAGTPEPTQTLVSIPSWCNLPVEIGRGERPGTSGLGDADEAEIRVRWPDSDVGPWMTVPADRFAVIDRSPVARLWVPAAEE